MKRITKVGRKNHWEVPTTVFKQTRSFQIFYEVGVEPKKIVVSSQNGCLTKIESSPSLKMNMSHPIRNFNISANRAIFRGN